MRRDTNGSITKAVKEAGRREVIVHKLVENAVALGEETLQEQVLLTLWATGRAVNRRVMTPTGIRESHLKRLFASLDFQNPFHQSLDRKSGICPRLIVCLLLLS